MGIELYAFALFIFVLICIVMLLGKRLFSDLKGQRKLLDEKETKLLLLYRTVEESLEEFFDQVTEAKSEIKMLGALHVANEAIVPDFSIGPRRPATENSAVPAAPSEPPRFQRVLDELIDDSTEAALEKNAAAPSRNEVILLLWNEGKDKTQIAQVLGITKTEVEIVLGLNGSPPKSQR